MSLSKNKPFYKSITNILVIVILLCFIFNLCINKEDALIGVNPHDMIQIGALSHTTPFWTFLSSLFIHVSFSHFVINIIMLWLIGNVIEEEYNIVYYLIIFFVGGLLGNMFEFFINENAVISGASGSVYALLGAFAALLITNKSINFENNKLLITLLLLTIGIGIIYTMIGVNINMMAHILGLLWGFIFPIAVSFTKQVTEYIKNYT